MKLRKFHVREFRSVWDSKPIPVDDKVTCMVGKNESGKTALLQALHGTNPLHDAGRGFETTYDYPKREVSEYEHAVEDGHRSPVVVVESLYKLECADLRPIEDQLGPRALECKDFSLLTYYGDQEEFDLKVDDPAVRRHLASTSDLPTTLQDSLRAADSWEAFNGVLEEHEGSEATARLQQTVVSIMEEGLATHIFREFVAPRMPKFLYFDEYYMLRGSANLDALLERERAGTLEDSDHPLLGLLNLARLDREKLLSIDSTAQLKNQIQGVANLLTSRIMRYWSQNRHLKMEFDVRHGLPGDPEGMQRGMNLWGEIYDTVHESRTGLDTRSHGFRWFFSFLAWYEDVKRTNENLILLLDEPGMALHGLAQEDLLKYFDTELGGRQLIYTTHSPFMVDPQRFERVRIVQDRGIDASEPIPRNDDGTKVLASVLDANQDSLFPVLHALGIGITQTFFIGPNVLVVEGKSDFMYLHTMSGMLNRNSGTGLSTRWVILPAGSISTVTPVLAVLSAQPSMNLAVLVDYAQNQRQLIENWHKKKLIKKERVFTFADITKTDEADVEDMFERKFYLDVLETEFSGKMGCVDLAGIRETVVKSEIPRVVKEIESHTGEFNHYRPARCFSERIEGLWPKVGKDTKKRFEKAFKKINSLLE